MKNRTVLIIFVVVQIIGLACAWFWQHPYSAASSLLWGIGLFILLPGNLLGSWVVESLLWQRGLTLGMMSVLVAVLTIGINAFVWFSVASIYRILIRRRSGAATPSPTT